MASKEKSPVDKLRDALHDIPHGSLDNDTAARVIGPLAKCWNQISGGQEAAMQAFKVERAEEVSWDPPLLSFTIERHGAKVLGSTRGELQSWTVNLDTLSASYTGGKYRQLTPAARKLDVKPLVARVCEAVQLGPGSDCELVKNKIVVCIWSFPSPARACCAACWSPTGARSAAVTSRR